MNTNGAPVRRVTRRQFMAGAGLGALSLVVAACGSSSRMESLPTTTILQGGTVPSAGGGTTTTTGTSGSSSTTSSTTLVSPAKHSGKVSVLYAGSLVALMQNSIGPAFHTATGYTVNGYSAGTTDLVTDIKGKVQRGDVFIAAAPSANASLEGASNGNWLTWYAEFATSPLVLGYNRKSSFASQLKTKPWYEVVTESGFKLGLTPPATDPKGVLAVEALDKTATSKGIPALKALGADTSNQFPEQTLVGRLQAGQLDAGFFYAAEAAASNIPTIPLKGISLSAGYTIAILKNGPNPAGAQAFIEYFLGSGPARFFKKDGFDLITPAKTYGTGIPTGIQSVISAA
jgi:molybdate/tungstate transport system substrate-binding protein